MERGDFGGLCGTSARDVATFATGSEGGPTTSAERADRGPNCDRCGQLKMKVTRTTSTTLTDPVTYLVCRHCKAATMRKKLTGSRRVMPDPPPAITATPDPESAVHPACYREWKDYVKAWDHLMSGRPWPKPAAREPVEEELR